MAIVITDPELLAKLSLASVTVDIRDPNGNYIGTFAPPLGKPPPGYVFPIPAEELNRRRLSREGKPLAKILKRLQGEQ